jgi:hypothetical protein
MLARANNRSVVARPLSRLTEPPTGPTDAAVRRLDTLGRLLEARRWPVQLAYCSVCGDLDVRLRVGRPDGSLAVELLGPYDDAPTNPRWQAVRIRAERRVVWTGPPRGCSDEELLAFVEELLDRDPARLAGRYLRQG